MHTAEPGTKFAQEARGHLSARLSGVDANLRTLLREGCDDETDWSLQEALTDAGGLRTELSELLLPHRIV